MNVSPWVTGLDRARASAALRRCRKRSTRVPGALTCTDRPRGYSFSGQILTSRSWKTNPHCAWWCTSRGVPESPRRPARCRRAEAPRTDPVNPSRRRLCGQRGRGREVGVPTAASSARLDYRTEIGAKRDCLASELRRCSRSAETGSVPGRCLGLAVLFFTHHSNDGGGRLTSLRG